MNHCMVLMFRLLVIHDFPFLSSCNGLTYIIFLFTSLFLHYSDLTRLNFPSPIPLAPAFLFFFSFHFYFLHLAKFWPSSKLIPHSFKVHSPLVPFFLRMLSAQIHISSSNPMTLRLHLQCVATPNLFITPVLFLKIRSRITWRRAR